MEAGDDDATRRKVVERHLAKVRSLYPLPKKVSVESPNGGASGEYTLDRDQKKYTRGDTKSILYYDEEFGLNMKRWVII